MPDRLECGSSANSGMPGLWRNLVEDIGVVHFALYSLLVQLRRADAIESRLAGGQGRKSWLLWLACHKGTRIVLAPAFASLTPGGD